MTKNQLIAQLKKDNPVLREGSDEQGYIELSTKEYDARIAEWADNLIAKEAQQAAKIAEAEAKAELLNKLGITQDEAKLLLS